MTGSARAAVLVPATAVTIAAAVTASDSPSDSNRLSLFTPVSLLFVSVRSGGREPAVRLARPRPRPPGAGAGLRPATQVAGADASGNTLVIERQPARHTSNRFIHGHS
ncbi:hypothetical protein GCM10027615_50360 [Plantactinospora veratri]